MSDTTIPGQEPAANVTDLQQNGAATSEPSLKELNDKYLAMQKELEIRKSEIAGLNRKNSEYEKAIQAKELEKLSEKERAEKELEIARAEKERERAETEKLRRDRIVDKILFENDIPLEYAERVKGKTEDEIAADVKAFNEFIEKLVEKRKEVAVNTALSGRPPVQGATPVNNSLQAKYNEFKAQKKYAECNAIIRQAQKDGIQLIQ